MTNGRGNPGIDAYRLASVPLSIRTDAVRAPLPRPETTARSAEDQPGTRRVRPAVPISRRLLCPVTAWMAGLFALFLLVNCGGDVRDHGDAGDDARLDGSRPGKDVVERTDAVPMDGPSHLADAPTQVDASDCLDGPMACCGLIYDCDGPFDQAVCSPSGWTCPAGQTPAADCSAFSCSELDAG
jgi:hypothetical protein